jgi:ring-1,2-phenylacetyl-CoA epoxidase subunit PaaD
MSEVRSPKLEDVWSALENVKDPEIPVLSVVDLGIITGIQLPTANCQLITITMTPTFVGCPAIDVMKKSIREEMMKYWLITKRPGAATE